MSIANKLNLMIDNLQNSYNALENKNATIPENKNFENLANTISSVPKYVRQFKSLDEMNSYIGKEGELAVVYGQQIIEADDNNSSEEDSELQPATLNTRSSSSYNFNYNPKWFQIPETFDFGELSALESHEETYSMVDNAIWCIFTKPEYWEDAEHDWYEMSNYPAILIAIRPNYIQVRYTPTGNIDGGIIYDCYYEPNVYGYSYYWFEGNGYSTWSILYPETQMALEDGFELVYLQDGNIPGNGGPEYSLNTNTYSSTYESDIDTQWIPYLSKFFFTNPAGGITEKDLVGFYQYVDGEWIFAPTQLNAIKDYVFNKKFYGINGVEQGTLGVNSNLTKDELLFKVNIYNQFSNGIQGDNLKDVSWLFANRDFYDSQSSIYNLENARPELAVGTYYRIETDDATRLPKFYLNNVINGQKMFQYAYISDNINEMFSSKYFNTSNLQDMSYMFANTSFYGDNNLALFDTSNVINMQYAFAYTNYPLPDFNTEKVQDMSHMFDYCRYKTTFPNLNVSNVTNTAYMFNSCRNLQNLTFDFNVPNAINMSGTFNTCSNLRNININTLNVVDTSYLFFQCYNLIEISNFHTNNVVNMDYMFCGCSNLIEVPNFNTSNVINMECMFDSCYNLTNIPNFNTNNVINMSYMFRDCSNLTTVSNFNTSNVINIECMFYQCYSLKEVPNFDTSNVINMRGMFQSCDNLTSIPNFNTNNVKYMGSAFLGCDNLTTMPNFNTNNVINMSWTFANCKKIPGDIILNINNVIDIAGTFDNCVSINTINITTANKLKNTYSAFSNCTNLTTISNFDTSSVVNAAFMFSCCDNITNIPNFNTINVTDMNCSFQACWKITEIPNFNTSNVTNMAYMFQYCPNLIEVPNFDTSNVRTMINMFKSCDNLITVPNFNTNKVTNMAFMLTECVNLINIPNFDTSNVINMYGMFQTCRKLTEIFNFNTNKVTDMSNMFQWCYNLTTIPNFNTNNVTNMRSMFSYCNNLQTIPNLNMTKVSNIYNMFSYCNNLVNLGRLENLGATTGDLNLYLNYSNNLSTNSVINIAESIATLSISNLYSINIPINVLNNVPSIYKRMIALKNWNLIGYIPLLAYEYLLSGQTTSIIYEYDNVDTITSENFITDIHNLNGATNLLTQINITCLSTASNITNFNNLFTNFANLQSVSCDNCYQITSINNMFSGCTNLTNINGFVNLGVGFENTNTTIEDRTLDLSSTTLSAETLQNLINNLGRTSVEAKIILGNNNFNTLEDEYKIVAAKKGWTVDGFEYTPKGMEFLVNLGVVNLASTVKGGSYAFEVLTDENGNTYLNNTNEGISNSKAEAAITITQEVINAIGSSITLRYCYSSESEYFDYGYIYLNNTEMASQFGGGDDWEEVSITFDIAVGDVIYITYEKDGSVDGGYDGIKIYLDA